MWQSTKHIRTHLGTQQLTTRPQVNMTLKSLDLYCNDIGPKGGVLLSRSLRRNTTLTSLNLNMNNIGNGLPSRLCNKAHAHPTPTCASIKILKAPKSYDYRDSF